MNHHHSANTWYFPLNINLFNILSQVPVQAHFSSDDDTQGLADSHTRSALRTTLARATTFEKKEQLLPASTLQGRLWRLVSPPKPDARGHYDVDLYEVKDVLHEIPLKYEVNGLYHIL